jgi:hypothetical protein
VRGCVADAFISCRKPVASWSSTPTLRGPAAELPVIEAARKPCSRFLRDVFVTVRWWRQTGDGVLRGTT